MQTSRKIIKTTYKKMSDDMLEAVLDLQEALYAVSKRGEILRSRKFRKKQLLEPLRPMDQVKRFFVLEEDKIIAKANTWFEEKTDDPNPDMIEYSIEVHPDYRRQGLATLLLEKLEKVAKEAGRNKPDAWNSPIDGPHGTAFLEKHGFDRVMVERSSRLYRDKINWEYIQQKKEKYAEIIDKYQFKTITRQQWADLVLSNDAIAEKFVDFYNEVVNLIPRDDIDMQDNKETVESLRQSAQRIKQSPSGKGINIYAFDGERVIAMSGTYYPDDPPVRDVGTGLTGVRKAYQRQGLASILKIMIIEMYLEKFPEFEFIFTENAQSNEGMLAINVSLGFEPAFEWEMWQRKTSK